MPTVHRFLAPYKPKLVSWSSSWRSGLSNLMSGSKANRGSKLGEFSTPAASDWSLRRSEGREEYNMKSIGREAWPPKGAEMPLAGSDSQIYLTRNVSVTYQHVNNV